MAAVPTLSYPEMFPMMFVKDKSMERWWVSAADRRSSFARADGLVGPYGTAPRPLPFLSASSTFDRI